MNIYILWNGSFGHTISSIDTYARLIYPENGTVLHISHKRSNEFLVKLYPHLKGIVLKNPITKKEFSYTTGRIIYNFIRIILKVYAAIQPNLRVYDRGHLYSILRKGPAYLICGDDSNTGLTKYNNITGWGFLLRNVKFKLNNLGKFDKSFCVIHLRYKGINNGKPGDYLRNRGNPANYNKLIEFILEQEIVQCIYLKLDREEDEVDLIKDERIILSKNDKETSIALIQNAKFYICQHSGPVNLCNVTRTPVFICDALPWWQGTYSPSDLILYKQPFQNQKKLSLQNLYKLPKEKWMIYGEFQILDNTEHEILNSFKEFYCNLSQFDGKATTLEVKKFRNQISNDILQKYTSNKISKYNLYN